MPFCSEAPPDHQRDTGCQGTPGVSFVEGPAHPWELPSLSQVATAPPSAGLRPELQPAPLDSEYVRDAPPWARSAPEGLAETLSPSRV